MIKIHRMQSTNTGTPGFLDVEMDGGARLQLCTLELPWRNNARNVSCIPPGIYPVVREWSARFQRDLWEVKDVPGRSEVKFHAGNTAGDVSMGYTSDVAGCILLGMRHGIVGSQPGILQSRQAVELFDLFLKGREWQLVIRDHEAHAHG